ncbi:trehalose-phosphatase [Candidatus Peribacteria bacterium RIFOXYC1_FULL_58_8]|nr:MAG: trehalose-phosphatase [Candidatus Peribacteria bacterium RIFOXYB1_FULL_57_12]OGJ78540.1 MAG: trehalose-phosphatase [Candidatus Peribacteria bacterium RIFOXYC1_FULL_58_8]
MRDILSHQGCHALQSLGGHGVLLAFDFDGTLAPLKPHPDLVRVPSSVDRALRTLASLGPVAIVSGRSLSDLRRCFPRFPGSLVGNHGAEGLLAHRAALRSARRACSVWRPHLRRLLHNADGAWLEDKVFSFTVHSRSPSALHIFERYFTREVLRSLPPIRFLPGKASINLLPLQMPHKGDALMLLLKRARAQSGLFVGDDETDEEAFAAARRRMITVRVGRGGRTRATFLLGSQREIGRLLAVLIRVRRSSPAFAGSRRCKSTEECVDFSAAASAGSASDRRRRLSEKPPA